MAGIPPTGSRPVSDDGQWEWDGTQWVPRTAQVVAATDPLAQRRKTNKRILIGAGLLGGTLLVLAIVASLMQPSPRKIGIATFASPSPSASPSPEPTLETTATVPPTATPATVPPVVAPTQAPVAQPAPITLTVHITESTYGHIAAQTLAGATCTAEATLPSGAKSSAQGLQGSQTAGSDGMVTWTYRTTTKTTRGTGTNAVTCQLNRQTASDSAPFTV